MRHGGQELTRSFGHNVVTNVTITGSVGKIHQFLAALPLLVQLIPHGTIGPDHVNHGLEFRVQFHQSLNGKRKTHKIIIKKQIFASLLFCCQILPSRTEGIVIRLSAVTQKKMGPLWSSQGVFTCLLWI